MYQVLQHFDYCFPTATLILKFSIMWLIFFLAIRPLSFILPIFISRKPIGLDMTVSWIQIYGINNFLSVRKTYIIII